MHGSMSHFSAISKRAELCRRRRTTKRIRYDSDAGKFVAKFDGFEGWYDIVFCTVIGRGVDTFGSIDHLAFLIDLDDYLVSNPGKHRYFSGFK